MIADRIRASAGRVAPQEGPATDQAFWLRADVGVYQDAHGTVPVTADGQPLRAWRDKATGLLVTDPNYPGPNATNTWVATDPHAGGQPSCKCLTNNIHTSYVGFACVTIPYTIFCVWNTTLTSGYGRALDGMTITFLMGPRSDTGPLSISCYSGGFHGTAHLAPGQCVIESAVLSDATPWKGISHNGGAFFDRGNALAPPASFGGIGDLNGLTIGGAGEFLMGNVAEIIAYHRVLSDADFAQTVEYLCNRYSVTP